ncbi:APA family fibronectin-binding glycoprotein [Streptomyces hesseae]|uniref:Alanine and proline-rich secreted protein Apa n=1 Tax=Streptomyces hesseae TaxID=3075519 RepID=A0ABU2SNE9_9ACTN|nr:APA family fibronectin-binding glycoprotein [Streptomyces sp. DSM 40473]MDT0449429.1 APA family fibronectin-binding glycoprotein [Streptomyces sp. DSM 40473]
MAAGLTALVVLLAGVGTLTWWLTRDGDDSPLAGRPRVNNTAAGLSYAIPAGWQHDAAKDSGLLSAFTSQIARKPGAGAEDDALGAAVMAGRSRQVIPASGLRQQTERAARSNAEFFFPDRPTTLEDSHPAKVGNQPAHAVTLKITDPKGSTAHLRMTVVTIDNHHTSFVMGVYGDTPSATTDHEVDAVLHSTTVR